VMALREFVILRRREASSRRMLLTMTQVCNGIKGIRHPEETRSVVSKDAPRGDASL